MPKFIKKKMWRKKRRNFKVKKPVMMNSKISKFPRGPFSRFNSIDPFPVQYNTKLVYTTDLTFNTNATQRLTGALQEFRLNSPHDPNYTSIAVAPTNTTTYAYKDLLSASGPYLRYKVNAVKIEILWYDPDIDGMAGVAHLLGTSDTAAISGQPIDYVERTPFTVVKRLNDSGSQRRKVVQYVPLHQLYGVSKESFRNNFDMGSVGSSGEVTAPYNNSPNLPVRLQLCAVNCSTSSTLTLKARIKLTYYTTCYQRYNLVGQESPV